MQFQFVTSSQIIFGVGSIEKIKEIAPQSGKKAFVVTGSGKAGPERVFELLKEVAVPWEQFVVRGEPSVIILKEGVELARKAGCDFVIGFGGGSVLDTAKAVSAMLTNKGEILDYLEVVGRGMPLKNAAAPMIALPTTSGTGTEVTKNAVLSVPDKSVKVSLRSQLIIPKYAIVDPELTVSMPPHVTASTGTDALTQVLEPYVSIKRNPMVDMFAKEGMRSAARSLRRAYTNGSDLQARTDMSWTSLMGGLSLANAGLGAVHGFAGPFGGMFPAPHGAVCGRLLPFVTEKNVEFLRKNDPENEALKRYAEIAKILTGDENAAISDGVDWLMETIEILKVPALSEYGATEADFPEIIRKSMRSSSMKGNPVKLSENDLAQILKKAL